MDQKTIDEIYSFCKKHRSTAPEIGVVLSSLIIATKVGVQREFVEAINEMTKKTIEFVKKSEISLN